MQCLTLCISEPKKNGEVVSKQFRYKVSEELNSCQTRLLVTYKREMVDTLDLSQFSPIKFQGNNSKQRLEQPGHF